MSLNLGNAIGILRVRVAILSSLILMVPNDSNGGSQSNLPPKGEPDSLSPARTEAAKRQARKWFAILLTIGLVLGAGVSVGVVKLLNELGLTQKPEHPFLNESPHQKQ